MAQMTRTVVVRNIAECRKCGDVIESHYRNDFKACKCGAIMVDGGRDYIKRTAKDLNDIIELSETYEEQYESTW